jgi:hypothetical protein
MTDQNISSRASIASLYPGTPQENDTAYVTAVLRERESEALVIAMGEEVKAAHARLDTNLGHEDRIPGVKKDHQRSLNMVKIADGKCKRALKNWEVQGTLRQRAQERVHAVNVPFETESVMGTQQLSHGN